MTSALRAPVLNFILSAVGADLFCDWWLAPRELLGKLKTLSGGNYIHDDNPLDSCFACLLVCWCYEHPRENNTEEWHCRDFTAWVPCLKPAPGSTHESGALRQVTEALEDLYDEKKEEGNPHSAFLLGLLWSLNNRLRMKVFWRL